MIADIFYPIFTLMITILACFTRKKVKLFRGFSPTRSPRHCPRPPGGGGIQLPPRAPASIGFGFSKNRCTHIFSALYPARIQNSILTSLIHCHYLWAHSLHHQYQDCHFYCVNYLLFWYLLSVSSTNSSISASIVVVTFIEDVPLNVKKHVNPTTLKSKKRICRLFIVFPYSILFKKRFPGLLHLFT